MNIYNLSPIFPSQCEEEDAASVQAAAATARMKRKRNSRGMQRDSASSVVPEEGSSEVVQTPFVVPPLMDLEQFEDGQGNDLREEKDVNNETNEGEKDIPNNHVRTDKQSERRDHPENNSKIVDSNKNVSKIKDKRKNSSATISSEDDQQAESSFKDDDFVSEQYIDDDQLFTTDTDVDNAIDKVIERFLSTADPEIDDFVIEQLGFVGFL